MNHTTKTLASKTDAELASIAEELGLQVDVDTATKNGLISTILSAQDSEVAISEIIPAKTSTTKVDKKAFARIVMANQEGVENTPFVKVQVNGTMYALPREVEVVVPASVVGVLNHAVATTYHPDDRGIFQSRQTRRFPFQVLAWGATADV
jgi:hypothetical protein